jgi:signal transduction histidine kinase
MSVIPTTDHFPPPDEGESSPPPVLLPAADRARRSAMRLVISVPALLVLFTLAFGLISYLLIMSQWELLESRGLDRVAAELLQGHLIAMIALVILSAGAGVGIVYTILRPIRAIEKTARGIIEGRLDQRVPPIRASDELGRLSHSFNSMIDFLNSCIEDRNRYMVEGIMTGLLLIDFDGRIKALNSTGAKLLGLDSATALGRTLRELRGSASSEDTLWDDLDEALRSDLSRMTDETVLNSSVGGVSLMVAISVLRDNRKAPFGLMLNFRDAAEMRQLSEQLGKADQLAALGTFTMGLAHELRNPLGSIKGMIQLLALERPQTTDAKEIIDRVVGEVNRLDRFIRELLDFSHSAPAPAVDVDLSVVLRHSVDQVRGQFPATGEEDMELIADLPPLPCVLGEPDRLVQAFSNILRNAFEAARPGSRITVRAETSLAGENRRVIVHFHNTGSTIRASDIDKVFDPFFSTKNRGSGLGLPIAYQILKQNGASVDLEVGPDEVDFLVAFPVKTPSDPREMLRDTASPLKEALSR